MIHADRIKPRDDSIGTYLENLKSKKYQIPTFQREIVWDKDSVKKLWDSIYKFYPIGSILVWKTDIKLQKHRTIGGYEIVDPAKNSDFQYILDGQQRTTALLTSLYGVGDKKEWQEDFDPTLYVDLTVEEKEDESETMFKERFLYPDEIERRNERIEKRKKGLIVKLKDIKESQRELTKKLEEIGHFSIDDPYYNNLSKMKNVLDNYRIPFIELKGIDTEEVCEIFERVNQEGEPLNIFDIVVAKTFRQESSPKGGFYLREMVNDFKSNTKGEFADIDYLTYLQMLAMIIRQNIENSEVHNITDTYLNNITAREIEKVWSGAKEAFRDTFDFFENHLHLKGPNLIPNRYFYITISSYFYENDDPDYEFLEKYFWYYSFHNEERLKHTQHLRNVHLEKLEEVKKGEEYGFEPFTLDRNDLRTTSYSYRGRLSRAILSLMSNQKPRDWELPERSVFSEVYYHLIDKPNLHHIFPRNFVDTYPGDNELDKDSLMNTAFLPQITNLEISDKNPIDYLKDYDNGKFEKVLETHLIPRNILEWSRNNKLSHKYLDNFIEKRIDIFEEKLKEKLEGITFNVRDSKIHDTNINLIIEEGEGQQTEFKSTLRIDAKDRGMRMKDVEYQSIRAINSFLNSKEGGKLLIGVKNDGSIYGLEEDYETFKEEEKREIFQRHLLDLVDSYIGKKFNEFIEVSFFVTEGKDVCLVEVNHADSPAFIERNGEQEFFIRTGNKTEQLTPKEQNPYISKHFEGFN